jgi:hypothetical protein
MYKFDEFVFISGQIFDIALAFWASEDFRGRLQPKEPCFKQKGERFPGQSARRIPTFPDSARYHPNGILKYVSTHILLFFILLNNGDIILLSVLH